MVMMIMIVTDNSYWLHIMYEAHPHLIPTTATHLCNIR